MKPTGKKSKLSEATIRLPDGMSLHKWMQEVTELATKAVVPLLPAATVDERGRYPDQWIDRCDMFPESVVLCVCRYALVDGRYQFAEWFYQVPYATSEDGMTVTVGAPTEVEREHEQTWKPRDSEDDEPEGTEDLGEAVDKPKADQRKKLPAAAYAVPFTANDAGEYDPEGTFQPLKSVLPHHINTAKDPDDDETVDLPRLRNALARFGQVDFGRFGDAAEAKKEAARKHLDAHAERLLSTKAEEAREHGLPELLADLRTQAIVEAKRALGERGKAAIPMAEGVLRVTSGKHPLAGSLAVKLGQVRAS